VGKNSKLHYNAFVGTKMKLTPLNKILIGISLLTIIACGGNSTVEGGDVGSTVNIHVKGINQAGAVATFTAGSLNFQVQSGQTTTKQDTIHVPRGHTAIDYTVAVTGNGGEHFTNSIVVGVGDEGKTVTITWPAAEDRVIVTKN
jgi:hypothetical protein